MEKILVAMMFPLEKVMCARSVQGRYTAWLAVLHWVLPRVKFSRDRGCWQWVVRMMLV